MKELRGKGWCVLGYLLWMLGSGMLLDAGHGVLAWGLTLTGAALFALGTAQSRRRAPAPPVTSATTDVELSAAGSGIGGIR